MFMGLGMPIPDLSNKPGPGRPGWGPAGTYDFQFEVSQGQVGITVLPRVNGLRFTVKWQDGTEQAITSAQTNLQSPTTQAGIISINNEKLDTTWCDDFKIASGQSLVTKVISWGQNPWNKLQDAFKDCTNLTEISTTSLITDTIGNLNNLFSGCTSLTDVSIKGWNLLSGCSIEGLFDACTNIEKLEATGLALKIVASSRFAFRQVGSNVANGCEFLMSGLDFSTSTSMQLGDTLERGMFREVKIKPNSNFSNWNLATSSATPVAFNYSFNLAKMLGDNSTLNISNWTFSGTTGSTLTGFFINLETSDSTNRGLNVDITNWNFGNINIVSQFFQNSDLNTVTGLNTLTASNLTNISSFFQYATFLSIPSNDNLSLSFRNAINTTSMSQFSQNLGSALANESDWGAFPNLDGVNLSNCTNFYFAFTAGRYSTGINLGNTTFSTNAVSYSYIFASVKLSAGNGIDLSTTTLKSSNFSYTFQGAKADFIKLGPGIDFSQVGQIQNFAYGAIIPDETLEFATNLSFGNLTNTLLFPAQKMSTCQTDNFIRRLYATQPTDAGVSSGTIYFDNSAVTESPSVVRNTANLLVSPGGWSFNGLNSTDATMPFEYTGPFQTGNDITPTINTSGGVFSSSDVTVNEYTGTFNTSTAVNATIRYTFPDGCYNEQVLNVVTPFTPFKFRVTGPISIKAQPAVAGQSFTIDWGDGSTPISTTGGTSIASNFTTAGTYDVQINAQSDATYCDEFAIVSGQTNVTQVLDWGENPWTTLSSAFLNCTSLTDISTTSLITGSGCVLSSAFKSCTSLTDVNISSWNMTNAARIEQIFDGCTGLEVFQASNLNLNHTSRWWLRGTGTAVTNGCEYRLNGLNITATSYAASNMTDLFTGIKINPSSSFANISWPSVTHATATFSGSSITGVNSTLDCSGWTNYNSASFPYFGSLTATEGGTSNMKINITNLSVSSVTSFNRSFLASNVSEIIGLNSLGASAGITNMEFAFYLCGFLSFSNSNFSNAFINSFSLTSNPTQAFRGVGASLSSGSAPPNLGSLNISGISSLVQMFQSAKFTSAPDFSNVVMSTTNPYDFNSTFNSMNILDNSNIDSLFAKTFKVSSFQSAFNNCQISSVTIGNNVDLSTCTTFNRAFLSASTISDVSFPTNADFSGVTTSANWEYMFLAGPTLSTCSVDNFIRRLHATALSYGLVINFNNAATTETPSVVSSKVADLEAAGWTITDNTTDATIPFEYTGTLEPDTNITPTNNTGGAFTGTFSSSDPTNIPVNSETGVINTPNGGSTTIRYTLADGCYTEQAIQLVSAEFSYSASEYCENAATDPTPTVTGTSGGIFTAALKVVPFKMQFEVASGVEKTIEIYASSTGSFTIDWGDNSTVLSNYTTGTISHTYNTGNVGTTVDPIISIGAQNDDPVNGAKHTTNSASDLIDIPQWGNMEFSKYQFQDRFQGCNNSRFQISATDAPNIETPVWNMRRLFYYATHFNSDISHWNADAGASFNQAFLGSNFNQPLNSWDVSRVTSFESTFQGTPFNQDLSGWDTSSATSFYYMFFAASSFNQNLSDWDISSLAGLSAKRMFRSTTALTDENYTDTVVGWAVFVYNNSGTPSTVDFTGTSPAVFIGTRTSDLASGQTYVAKYGANWPSSWTNNNAQDAYDYLTTTLSWTIN